MAQRIESYAPIAELGYFALGEIRRLTGETGENSEHLHLSSIGSVLQVHSLIGESNIHTHISSSITTVDLLGEHSTHVHASETGALTQNYTIVGLHSTIFTLRQRVH